MRINRAVLSLAAFLLLNNCGGGSSGGSGGGNNPPPAVTIKAQVYLTTTDQLNLLTPQNDVSFDQVSAGSILISVDPATQYQTMVGFGAAMTDASAYVLKHNMSTIQRQALMSDLFGASPGLNLSLMRLTIGASDFSQTHYSYDDMPAGQTDPSLAQFSIAKAKIDVVPVVKEAIVLNANLKIMASPWSAPGWMKTSDSLITGALKPSAFSVYADYLTRYSQNMQTEGVPIAYLSMQNEPFFEPNNYPGMSVSNADRAAFIGRHLGPKLLAAGLGTKILDWDHNWDNTAAPLAVLGDATANPFVSGVAWHCYAGNVSAQSVVRDAYPMKDVFFTECSGGDWAPNWGDSFDWTMQNLIIGSTRNWAKGVLLWNLALDENHGPHLGGCGNCRGVVTVNSVTGAVTRNLEYYALAHASRFVKQGAKRIASNSGVNGIEDVAFQNPDGSIILIVLNTANAARTFSVASTGSASIGGKMLSYTLAAGAAANFVWTP